jgi:hypothetical protein
MCGFVLYDTQLIVEKRRMGNDDFIRLVNHVGNKNISYCILFARMIVAHLCVWPVCFIFFSTNKPISIPIEMNIQCDPLQALFPMIEETAAADVPLNQVSFDMIGGDYSVSDISCPRELERSQSLVLPLFYFKVFRSCNTSIYLHLILLS